MKEKIYAVITGDLIGYSNTKNLQREKLLDAFKFVLKEIEIKNGNRKNNRFGIFRGDSFQGLIFNPEHALNYALKIRTFMKMFHLPKVNTVFDARMAIGIGKVDKIKNNITESDGEAFRLSGPTLDKMTNQTRIKIRTSYQKFNDEFDLICMFIDVLVNKWTQAQSEVVYYLLDGFNQTAIAEKLKVSQAAVNQRIRSANWHVINAAIKRYEQMISERIIK